MDFIGREEEIAIMSKALADPGFSSVFIYGRRRVGKTELIRHCLKNVTGRIIPFCAGKTLYATNFESFSTSVAKAYNLPLSFQTLSEALSFIGEAAKKEKTVLVIDEYCFFRDSDGVVDSAFQLFIDTYQHSSHLTLILSGSIVRTMKEIIDNGAPLYGRFQNILSLAPFGYEEAALFYPERSPEEKLCLYALFGGVPHYLLLIDPKETPSENVIRLLFGVNGVLKNEAETLLNDELSVIENANAVLGLLGNKALHYSDINQLYPSSSGNGATYILKKLLDIGLLKKSVSLDPHGEKNAVYEIADPFIRFYFAFYLPTRSPSLLYSPNDLFTRFVEKDFKESYLPCIFEEIARQFLANENKKGRISEPLLGLGSYFYSQKDPISKKWVNGQFDVVTKDAKGYCDYECKYHSKPLSLKDVTEEKASVLKCGVPFYKIGFFSRSGFTEELLSHKEYPLFSLNDLYPF
jgi:AAA+ ATPase superfamily predicted ATPase